MSEPCAGCAFTEGSEANLGPHNNLRAQLCLLGAIPFYCHHGREGELRDLRDIRPEDRRREIQAGRLVSCRGWKREVSVLSATGYYGRALDLKRAFAQLGIGALLTFTSTEDAARKRKAAKTLRDVIIALNRSRGYAEVGGGGEAETVRAEAP